MSNTRWLLVSGLVILALAGTGWWSNLSETHGVFAVLNAGLIGGGIWLLVSTARRKAVFRSWSGTRITLVALWFFLTTFSGLRTSFGSWEKARKTRQVAAEIAEKSDARFRHELEALKTAVAQERDRVALYEKAGAAQQAFQSLGAKPQHAELDSMSKTVMDQNKDAFAEHLLTVARAAAEKGDDVAARDTLMEALRLAPGLTPASTLLGEVKEKADRTEAQQKFAPVLARVETRLTEVTEQASNGEVLQADSVLDQLIDELEKVPEQARPSIAWDATHTKVTKKKAALAPKVKKERERIEQEKAEQAALDLLCGPSPVRSGWNGEVLAVKHYLKRTANDPDSIEVSECAIPQLTREDCWITTCKVRGRNAFGGKILNVMRFSIGRHPKISDMGEVISATTL